MERALGLGHHAQDLLLQPGTQPVGTGQGGRSGYFQPHAADGGDTPESQQHTQGLALAQREADGWRTVTGARTHPLALLLLLFPQGCCV